MEYTINVFTGKVDFFYQFKSYVVPQLGWYIVIHKGAGVYTCKITEIGISAALEKISSLVDITVEIIEVS